ncbi:helix-turn-helix transcriptional regulator [Pluralibacter gergoviae]
MEHVNTAAQFPPGVRRQSVGDVMLTTVAATLQQDRVMQDTCAAHLSLILMIKGAGHYGFEGGMLHAFQPDTLLITCSRESCRGNAFFPRHFFYDLCIIDFPLRYIPILTEAGMLLPDQPQALFHATLPAELKLLHQQIQQLSHHSSLFGTLVLESLLLQALWQGVRELQSPKTCPCRAALLSARDRQRLIKAREFIRQQQETVNLDAVARACGLAPVVLKRGFREMFGITPWNFVIRCRLERAETLLLETEMSLDDIAVRCGFSHASHLSRFFQRQHGVSPGRFRRQQLCI